MPFRSARHGGAPRRWLAALFLFALLALAPAFASAQGTDSTVVSWTAPGDDGRVGTAAAYDLRVSEAPITAGNFGRATAVTDLPAPRPSGTMEHVTVRGLSRDRNYYFAIRTVDDQGNWSGLSNVVLWDWSLDAAPPRPPRGGHVKREKDGVHVSWDPNTEPDLAGYNLYRRTDGGAPERVNGSPITGTSYVDAQAPENAQTLAYAITAVDARGNESAAAQAGAIGLTAVDVWKLQPGYPNPSRLGESVRLPLQVPADSRGDVVVEILDSGGRIVKRIVVASPTPGATEVVWDGTNDAGRATAPGVYRGWLIAGDTRSGVRLLRVP